MIGFPAPYLVAMLVFGAAGVVAVLHTLAQRIKHERDVHDLRIQVHQVRAAYAQRLAELAARERGVELADAEPVEERRAA